MAKILIADDERVIRQSMCKLLCGEGHEVESARNGEEAVSMFAAGSHDLVILDIDMPKVDGFSALRQIRGISRLTPVVFLTANSSDVNHLRALGLGADDFIAKDEGSSFSDWSSVFLARVRRALERAEDYESVSGIVKIGRITVDVDALSVSGDGRSVRMTRTEGDIIRILSSQPNRYFSKDELICALRGGGYACEDGMLYTHISNLRKKLGPAGESLMCDRRSGYKLTI